MRIAAERTPGGQGMPAVLLDFLAVFFILAAPYLNFVQHSEFFFEAVNLAVLAIVAAVAAVLAGLMRVTRSAVFRVAILAFALYLFLDIQLFWLNRPVLNLLLGGPAIGLLCWVSRRWLSLLLATGFGTILASTLLIALWTGWAARDGEPPARQATNGSALPVYVHLILDELAGPEAFDDSIPAQGAIKSALKTFFADQGFRLYGRAFSPYYDSPNSIAAALNLERTQTPLMFYAIDGLDVRVTENRSFDLLRSRGYGINVYQSSYMDYCGANPAIIRSCTTYNFDGATSVALASLSRADKARVVLTMYSHLFSLAKLVRETYGWLHVNLAPAGRPVPAWVEAADRLGPIPVMPVFDRLIGDVAAGGRGQAYFAHLFIPHYPYSLDASCRIRRPVMTWKNRYVAPVDAPETNTAESRLARYEAYASQVRCALRKTQELLDALQASGVADDATVIIHGDHGSRIVRIEPRAGNRDRVSAQDINDGFLALYAVRSPAIAPGYDEQAVSLPQLMRNLVYGDDIARAAAPRENPPRVFLRDHPYSNLIEVPVPCVPGAAPAAASAAAGETPPAVGLAARCGTGQAVSGAAAGRDG